MNMYAEYDKIKINCKKNLGIGGHCHATSYKKTCIEWRV